MRLLIASLASFLVALLPLSTAVPVHELLEDPQKLDQLTRRFTPPTPVSPANSPKTPINTLLQLLNTQANPDPDLIKSIVAFDATYVSVTGDNPELHALMPWAGTRAKVGPQAFIDTFTRVGLWWRRGPFSMDALFSDAGGGNVSAWGTFTLISRTMNRSCTSPWAVRAEFNGEGLITYFQYMEDTFGTAETFWAGGSKKYCANPYGGCVWM
ncbi:hypothetical protein HD806DRAFT_541263 [Neofusicoccum parvum]|uniref:Uncharacterized protein n=1 Tax=Neofusicoccum parvum TaxID=310453 RepID=A0ACB5RZF4_9PEZI|nr:hypothetical protein HD806DRAFT_541263 [Neofusicoccum parvum]